MWLIATKELRELLYSPRFVIISIASLVLILLSLFNGYAVYQTELKSVSVGQQLAEEKLSSRRDYRYIDRSWIEIIRPPEKLAIFDIGVSGVIGRKSSAGTYGRPLRESRYSKYPILALFGELDLTFITGFILSLFALLFGYSSVSGERERGTLQLMMSHSLSRHSVIIGKLIGAFIPLALIFILPFLLGLAGLMLMTDINFSRGEWARIGLMAAAHMLYLLVFLCIGLATSSITRSSFTSFLLSLFIWAACVAIIPKVSVYIAYKVTPPMSSRELTSRWHAYWIENLDNIGPRLKKYLEDRPMTEETYRKKEREIKTTISEENRAESNEFSKGLHQEFKLRRMATLRTATYLSALSPTSNLNFSTHILANTGPRMLEVFDKNLKQYSREFRAFTEELAAKHAGEKIRREMKWKRSVAEDGRITGEINEDYEPPRIDISGLPRFQVILPDLTEISGNVLPYFAILVLQAIIFFSIAFVAFLRYDVR